MAFKFFSNMPGKNGGDGTSVKTIDASIIAKLGDNGYTFTDSGMTTQQVLSTSQPAHAMLVEGSSVPVYQNSFGAMFVVDENSKVYIVSKTPTAEGNGPFLGGGFTSTGIPTPGNNSGIPGGSDGGSSIPLPGRPNPTPPTVPVPGIPTPLPPPPGGLLGSGRIFTGFQAGDIIPNQEATITRAMWSNNVGNLLTFYTSSAQTATQKRYYYEVFNSGSSAACTYEPQFSVAYGHKQGSGSADEGGQINDTPSRAIYGQYRLLCLNPGVERFVINGSATDQIYVINVNRARFREKIDEGNIEINLHHLSGSQHGVNATHTGSNVKLGTAGAVLRLIDDSNVNSATVTQAGEVYNLVSGSIEDGVYNPSNLHKYGLLYPRLGVAVIDANLLDMSASFLSVTGSEVPGDNAWKMYTAMSGAALYTDASGDRLGFSARSSEKVKSTHYFVRVKNGEYNFSNNPTFTTGSEGDFSQPTFINNPQTYITTVGLYNSRRELLAVAKLSKPLLKNFTLESLIKVKLDY